MFLSERGSAESRAVRTFDVSKRKRKLLSLEQLRVYNLLPVRHFAKRPADVHEMPDHMAIQNHTVSTTW
jgi:hypothetical protein